MKYKNKWVAIVAAAATTAGMCFPSFAYAEEPAEAVYTREYYEEVLNLANNAEQCWTYDAESDSWTLTPVSAVAFPVIPEQQGVSVCVPGAYVKGIDTDLDGVEDIASDEAEESVYGTLVIDHEAEVISSNGQTYTADTAPVILNTGAAGYGSQTNQPASSAYASEGYINVSCGNRGKQDSYADENGETVYTGDAPSCLVDQKNAARFVKYNILLGNLPGSVDFFVSTGGSGGGAHAVMFAATSDNEDFYDYEIEAGAVGVYKNEDGSYSTTVTIDGTEYDISDGAWGCVAYSAITSLAEADMALAFEYYLDTDYSFNTEFQKKLAEYLSQEYMEYINGQNLSVPESAVGFDLNQDGDTEDDIALTIEYDEEKYAETNGYGGTYLDLYLAEFTQNLQWYLDNLDYAEGWTWFDAEGNALSDEETAALTSEEKAAAFLEGRVAGSTGRGNGFPGGGFGGRGMQGGPDGNGFPEGGFGRRGMQGGPDGNGFPGGRDMQGEADENGASSGEEDSEESNGIPEEEMGEAADAGNDIPEGDIGEAADAGNDIPEGEMGEAADAGNDIPEGEMGEVPDGNGGFPGENMQGNTDGAEMIVGTPDQGTTQSASGGTDSNTYASYDELLAAYEADIAEVQEGDRFGNNQVELYDPLHYIGAEGTADPTWARIVMGASEGDMSMFSSLNLQLAMLAAGVDAEIEWQWNGGHVPSEIFGNSLSLYVDQMYGKYVEGASEIVKAEAVPQTENGTAEEPTAEDISGWVSHEDVAHVSVTLADAASYRTNGASKATPGFDVIDYGQEDYVFGSETQDARHWDSYLLKVLQEHAEDLSELFNQS